MPEATTETTLFAMATQQDTTASMSSLSQPSTSTSSSNSSSGVSGDNTPPPPHPDEEFNDEEDNYDADAEGSGNNDGSIVFANKQLIAHLLRIVCAQRNNNNNNNNNKYFYSSSSNGGASSHSGSPPSDDRHQQQTQQQQQQQQQIQQQQQQQQHHQQQDPVPISTDHLSVASSAHSTGGGLSFSASPAYISPFAQSPISEASPWSHPAISLDVLQDPRTMELERVLLRLCDEFEQRLHEKFDEFSANLDTEPATIRDSVTRELEALYYDGNIHWGRVIAVFAFCREICDKCRTDGRPQLSAPVQLWVAEFIDRNLWDWMVENQGWLGLLKFYRETGGDKTAPGHFGEGASGWHSVASLLTISAVTIAIALAAAYFRR